MRTLTILLAASLTLLACKKDKNTDYIETCYFFNPWLSKKVLELKNCTCETIILSGTYNGQLIYEIRVVDPRCNSINTVHKEDGTPLFHSGDEAYDIYLNSVKNLNEVWRCSDQNK